jgi:hypothetical protein
VKKCKRDVVGALLVGLVLWSSAAFAGPIDLYESRFRIDGVLSPTLPDVTYCCNLGGPPAGLPAPWNVAAFDFTTGLGTFTATVTGAGSHTIVAGLNHDLMPESDPNFANESAQAVGAAGGTLWEIDEPGYVSGNLFENVAGTLENANDTPGPEDISWALGRSFTLAAGETGTLTFRVATTAPGGFYLNQWENDFADQLYFSVGDPVITGGPVGVPEPGTLLLLGTGVTFILVRGRKFLRGNS